MFTRKRFRVAILWLPLFFVMTGAADARAQANGAIAGIVHDGLSGEPLGNVQVLVRPEGDSTVVAAGGLTASSGRFSITGLRPGRYRIAFHLLGYAGTARTITVPAAGAAGALDLGDVQMTTAAITLDEVTVIGAPDPVTYAPDRDIYSVDAMPAAAGGVATDALGQVPDLEVDVNGEVLLRGNTPTIYINGRPAPMRGESLAIFLQQFPAENIQSIEVMPNPSARYEAEGAGGIVNIVLKRGVRLGLTGNVFANAGSRGEAGTGGRATYQAGDLTIQGGGSARITRTETSTAEMRHNLLADPITLLEQESISDRAGNSGNLDLEVEYSLSERTRLTGQSRFSGNFSDADRITSYTEMDADRSILDEYDRLAVDGSRGLSTDLSFELRHDFAPRGHDFNLEVEYQRGRDSQESLIRQRLLEEIIAEDPTIELTLDDANEHQDEMGMRLDYSRPFTSTGQIEIGYQNQIGETVDANLRRIGIEGGPDGEMEITDRGLTQRQTVHSGYLTTSQRLGKFNAQLGVRSEFTNDRYSLNADGTPFGNEYFGVYPNANLTYSFTRQARLRASYSVRVRRPTANILNPTNRSTDPLNRRVGNPDIDPQYTHSFSVDASWNRGPATFRIAPFYQRSVDEFTQYKTVDALGISTTTWENLSSSAAWGTSLSLALRNFHGFGGSVNLNGRREQRDGSFIQEEARRSSARWSVRTNLDKRIGANLTVQGSMTYNPPRELTQGRSAATVMTSTAIRQRLMGGRASISLNITDPLDLYRPSTTTIDRGFMETGRDRVSIRRAALSLSYTFGGRGRGGARGGARGQQAPERPAPVREAEAEID
ncbi:MAG TPA: TonB-dependent receptor [Longimicrobiaceae bacterium]